MGYYYYTLLFNFPLSVAPRQNTHPSPLSESSILYKPSQKFIKNGRKFVL